MKKLTSFLIIFLVALYMGNVFAASTLESNNQESQSESTFTVEAKYAETFLTKIEYPSAVSNHSKQYIS
ncbi:MAG: hypothetical protein NUV45_09380 [Tepidanaerobacteraceae bacterium]|jgi:hypothetical protein|nr:hypothetical protein [Tepidanaerobacteraceae bacterium]